MAIEGEIRKCRVPEADGTGTTQVKIDFNPISRQPCVKSLGTLTPNFAAVLSIVPKEHCDAQIMAGSCPRGLKITPQDTIQAKS